NRPPSFRSEKQKGRAKTSPAKQQPNCVRPGSAGVRGRSGSRLGSSRPMSAQDMLEHEEESAEEALHYFVKPFTKYRRRRHRVRSLVPEPVGYPDVPFETIYRSISSQRQTVRQCF